MAERQDDLKEIRALLPWFVNGTLDPERAERVRERVAASRELAAEVAWLGRLRALTLATAGQPIADRAGADALLARIAAEQDGGANVRTLERRRQQAPRWWRAALAIAAVLLVVQGLTVIALLQRGGDGLPPPGAAADDAGGATL